MKLNVYDFDGTIYDGDSTIDFLLFLIKKKKKLIIYIPKFIFNYIKYKFKLTNKEKLKEVFFSILKFFDNIDELLLEFWEKNESKIKDFFKEKKEHDNDIIASASPEFLLKPIAKKYNVKKLFGSQIDKKTGTFSGLNCHGREKINRINKTYTDAIIYEMYSDDIKADKPLLDLAQNSYIVKKDIIIPYIKNQNKKKINIFKKYNELIKYLIVGFLTVLITILSYYICTLFLNPNNPIQLQVCNIISWISAVIFAYYANRIYVFKSENTNKIKEAIIFITTRIITLLLDMLIMFIFVSSLSINDKISKLISQFIVIVANYIISKYIVFKK